MQRRPAGRRNYYSVCDADRLTDLLAATERLVRQLVMTGGDAAGA